MQGLTLAAAEEAFKYWRAQRSSVAEAIPEKLWTMALGLYPEYKRSTICEHLRLSGGQFKRRLDGVSHDCVNSGFVYASREVVQSSTKEHGEIKLVVQGKERCLTCYVDTQALHHVLPSLGALL